LGLFTTEKLILFGAGPFLLNESFESSLRDLLLLLQSLSPDEAEDLEEFIESDGPELELPMEPDATDSEAYDCSTHVTVIFLCSSLLLTFDIMGCFSFGIFFLSLKDSKNYEFIKGNESKLTRFSFLRSLNLELGAWIPCFYFLTAALRSHWFLILFNGDLFDLSLEFINPLHLSLDHI
jgi:hypothetical protein